MNNIVKFNGNELEMYTSTETMPITTYMKHNLQVMIDANIGADMDAFDSHMLKLSRYSQNGDKENHSKQIGNIRQCYHFIINNINPEFNSFVTLIKKLNGKPIDDLSDENVQRIVQQLGKEGLTVRLVRNFLDYVKKKSKASYRYFFRNKAST